MFACLLAATLALAIAVSSASASEASQPTAPTTEPAPTLVSETPPGQVAASKKSGKKPYSGLPRVRLGIAGTVRVRSRRYVLPRTKVELRGEVNADLGVKSLTIAVKRRGRTVKKLRARVTTRGRKSTFKLKFRPGKRGKYLFKLRLEDPQLALVSPGAGASVSVVRTNIKRGSSGVAVRVFQSRLAALKYVVPLNGKFDAATARAFMAFRKNSFMARKGTAGSRVASKLAAGKGGFKLRHRRAGRHIEVSIKRQVMALADNGKVQRVYHVSTGAPATPTIRGTYRVYRKDWGTNEKGMVHSAYFIRGYAIHGFASVPNFNASHGCVRVPIPNAVSIFNWISHGTRIDTYN